MSVSVSYLAPCAMCLRPFLDALHLEIFHQPPRERAFDKHLGGESVPTFVMREA